MADIADAVRLQKASLYHHVSSKQEILLALLDRALDMLTEYIGGIAHQPLQPDKKLRAMIHGYLRALADHGDLTAVLLFEHRSLDRRARARHVPQRDRFEALWREALQEGVRARAFHCPDVALTVRALMGALNWTLTWYRPDGGSSIDDIADGYADLFLNGMLRPTAVARTRKN